MEQSLTQLFGSSVQVFRKCFKCLESAATMVMVEDWDEWSESVVLHIAFFVALFACLTATRVIASLQRALKSRFLCRCFRTQFCAFCSRALLRKLVSLRSSAILPLPP